MEACGRPCLRPIEAVPLSTSSSWELSRDNVTYGECVTLKQTSWGAFPTKWSVDSPFVAMEARLRDKFSIYCLAELVLIQLEIVPGR